MTNPEATTAQSIAIVDDDPRIRKLLSEELSDYGYKTICYEDGFTLLDQIASTPHALILMDLMMPQLDGIECLRRLREAKYPGPVVVFTALSDNEKRREAAAYGAVDYVLKPDLFEDPARIVGKHLMTVA